MLCAVLMLFAVAAPVDADTDLGAQVVSSTAKRRSFVCVALGTWSADGASYIGSVGLLQQS